MHFTNRGGGDLALDNSTSAHGIGIQRTDASFFTVNGFDFLGGGDGEMSFFDGNTKVARIALTGLPTHFDFRGNLAFVHINFISYCGFCVSGFSPQNAIDNLDFTPIPPSAVPEPGSFVMVATAGLAGLGFGFRAKKKK